MLGFFPLEILTQIVTFLPPRDVLALYLCGSSRTTYYLEHGAVFSHVATLLPLNDQKWPSWTVNLQLKSILVRVHPEFIHWNYLPLDIVRHLPLSTTELRLKYRGSSGEITRVSSLGTLLPHLRFLEIQMALFDTMETVLRVLPQTLEKLEITIGAGVTPLKLTQNLPSSLRSLVVHGSLVVDPAGTFQDIELPTTLENLEWEISEPPLCRLPSNLTRLFEVTHYPNKGDLPSKDTIRTLPDHFKAYETLLINLDEEVMAKLPRALEELRICTSKLQNFESCLSSAPPALTSLSLLFRGSSIKLDDSKILPRNLTLLRLDATFANPLASQFFSCLPPSITALHVPLAKIRHHTDLTHLPSGIKALSISTVGDQDTPLLPRGLRFLRVSHCRLTQLGMTSLPRSLQTLIVRSDLYLEGDVSQLPDLLEADFQLATARCSSVTSRFPHTILQFCIIGTLPENWSTCLPNRLTHLMLEDRIQARLSSTGLLDLPSTLTKLKVYISPCLESQHMQNLPKGLVIAEIDGVSSNLSNSDMAMIPRGVLKLKLPVSHGITDECMPLLPSRLVEFRLGDFMPVFWALLHAKQQLQNGWTPSSTLL